MAVITEYPYQGQTKFYLPRHTGDVSVTVNNVAAAIEYQDSDEVVLQSAVNSTDIVAITYTPASSGGGGGTGGAVTSVAGRTGDVTLVAGDVSGLATVATSGGYADLSGRPTLATVATSGAYADLSTKPTVVGGSTGAYLQDTVYAITDGASVDLNPANGGVQTWTLGANRSPTASSFASGQSILLLVTAGSYSITFPSVTWTKQGGGGAAPTLSSTGKTAIVLWKVGTTLYGSYLGDA